MAINNRDRQRTKVVYVPVNTGGGSGGGTQEKIKVGESGLKFANTTFTEIPEIFDFSDVTNLADMFRNCSSLTTAPQMDTSQVTNMGYMFYYCTSLTSVPEMDTSKVTSMQSMFYYCESLISIPEMNTSEVTNMETMFLRCKLLTTIPPINTSRVTRIEFMFSGCNSLTDLGGFTGLKVNLDLSPCSKLSHESLLNVINNAADVTASPATLTLGSTNLAKLSDEEKGIATNKGWTLA